MTEQELHPFISADRVRRFAAEETLICLQAPPFPTIAKKRAVGGAGDFWERSDSPIILDYARSPSSPPVLRLRWGSQGKGNEWVLGAYNFDEFAEMLGLT
jgi:hypothetical protein